MERGRIQLGCRRIQNILRMTPVATMRTLEQKISDAGPFNQRVDPHILTRSRKELQQAGHVTAERQKDIYWYRLSATPKKEWRAHLDRVSPILRKLHHNNKLIGNTFEIAVFQALLSECPHHDIEFLGGFPDLDPFDQTTWKKIEPTIVSGQALSRGRNLDFILLHHEAGRAGIEVKNTREWIYPYKKEVCDFIGKCCELDAVPVMICRRYAYVTYSVLYPCGVLLHENYNQLLPESMRVVGEKAKDKELLGYHDIKFGVEPDQRLLKFIGKDLPGLLPQARERFDQYKDLLWEFANGMNYKEFAARLRRRSQGLPEDFDLYEDF